MTHSLGRDEDGPGGAGEPGSESRSGGKQCVPEHQAQALHSKSSLASFELELASAMAKPSKPSQVKFQLVLIRRPTLSHRLKAMRTRLMCRPFGAQHLNRTSTRIVPTSLAPNILLASSRCSSKSNDQISFASAEARGSCKRVARGDRSRPHLEFEIRGNLTHATSLTAVALLKSYLAQL
mmetsp:Transcript_171643/g.550178  ORF Transcript_171643/g.550178 Transcript_171643/m.550178 type:complete len:180 (-) Transcript_171643:79-618(-)